MGKRWIGIFVRWLLAAIGLLLVLFFLVTMEFTGVGWRSSILTARKVASQLFGVDEWIYVYHQKVSVDRANVIVNDVFFVPEECNYSFRFNFPDLPNRPKNDIRWLDENSNKVWPKTFRVSVK